MTDLFARAARSSTRVFYLHRGRTFTESPRIAYLHEKIAGLMEALTLQPRASSSLLAVGQPQECRLEAVVPWLELE
jgi:hypothetical protein